MKEVNEEHDHVHFEIIICSVALRKKKKKSMMVYFLDTIM